MPRPEVHSTNNLPPRPDAAPGALKGGRLSPAMMRALAKLTTGWLSAYTLRESLGTLKALEDRGLAVSRHAVGSMAFPRNCIYFRLATARAAAPTPEESV